MSYGSYVQSDSFYSNLPKPYLQGDRGAAVPGWGSNPGRIGPPMVGIGAFGAVCPPGTALNKTTGNCARVVNVAALVRSSIDAAGLGAIPWWGWAAGAVLIGGGIAYATTRRK